jgi:DNA repair photolyase
MLMAKRFGKVKGYDDWIKPRLVSNALELLDQEIPKYKDQINFVHLSFTTDPFMYGYKEVGDLTLKIIKKLNQNGIRASVLTKGVYPRDLVNKEEYGSKNAYGVTLVSLNPDFKKRFEPYSAPFRKRIESLKHLHDAGLETWVSIEPYPTPNLIEQDLTKILERVSFVDRIVFGKLNYNTRSSMFRENDEFYEDCAERVISFCKKNDIAYHIKFGTQKEYNQATETLLGDINDINARRQSIACARV